MSVLTMQQHLDEIPPALSQPEGFRLCTYRDEHDADAWLECACAGGLIAPGSSRDVFVRKILPLGALQENLFFLFHGQLPVGTVACRFVPSGGELLMLAIKPEYRSRGLGRLLLRAALRRLAAVTRPATLQFVDTQGSAAKLFLSEGFQPVDNAVESREQWSALLAKLGVDSASLLTDAGLPCGTIYRQIPLPRKKVRIGVFGIDRGAHMMHFCLHSPDTELVALCDTYEPTITRVLSEMDCSGVALYSSFDAFIRHPMDAVVLANYATEHAPYAIRCLQAGLHVYSEVLPASTVAEAVRLADAVEQSSCIYAYGENYSYMPATRTMRRLVRQGLLGRFEYGEGEYMHDMEPIFNDIIQHNPNHWRKHIDEFYYCTHSVGPLLHSIGLRPVRVTGFTIPRNEKCDRLGVVARPMAMEIITLENGGLLKSIHSMASSRSSVWYSLYGTKGRMESAREDAGNDGANTLYVNCGEDGEENAVLWPTADSLSAQAELAGHSGSDFYTMYHFIRRIQGDRNADIIGIYEALDIFLTGRFALLSAQNGNSPMEIPDFRSKSVRDRYR